MLGVWGGLGAWFASEPVVTLLINEYDVSYKTDQNKIYLGYDNPVVFEWSFTGEYAENVLNTFDEVKVTLGGEVYSTISTPVNLFIVGDNELRLKIGDSTSLTEGSYLPEIIGYAPGYDDGYLLNGVSKVELSKIIVKG